MTSQWLTWDDGSLPAIDPTEDDSAALQAAVHTADLLLEQPALAYPGGAMTSARVTVQNVFEEDETTLYAIPLAGEPAAVAHDYAARLLRLDVLDAPTFAAELDLDETQAAEIALHTAINAPYAITAGPAPLLAIMNTADRADRLAVAFPGLPVLAYTADAVAAARALRATANGQPEGSALLIGRGVLVWAATGEAAYQRLLALVEAAESYLAANGAGDLTVPEQPPVGEVRQQIAAARKAASAAAGVPLNASICHDAACRAFAADFGLVAKLTAGMPSVGAGQTLGLLDSADDPRAKLDATLGAVGFGLDVEAAFAAREALHHSITVVRHAEALGGYVPVLPKLAPAPLDHSTRAPFSGEVCMVTGAASGIGKACVQAFLDAGAAVVGLDINPAIETLFDRPDYTGLVCDITDAAAVSAAYEKAAFTYGGLDMLVLNAGLFPKGTRIAELDLSDFMRVMHVNLDANLVLMRLAHPLLVQAPNQGRVVVNGSRNALAPGPGAAAYSTSKAALTQLGRVAALEWGGDGIRVNMIHAHAVFDTGLWTPEVLAARAAHYGITVEEYKTNNVLKTEVKSADVANLAVAMCGPLFARTTGAQVPIDGGSERVI